MGCNQSKIENEEAVSRCKERKQFMKLAVSARNAFAAAHSAYAVSLKNTGAALSDYGHAELYTNGSTVPVTQPTSSSATTVQIENLPPPPPPLIPPPPPNDFQPQPLQRAATMPEMMHKVGANKPMSPTIEEEEDEMIDLDKEELVRKRSGSSRGKRVADADEAASRLQKERELERRQAPPAPGPQNDSTWDYFFNTDNMPGPSLAEQPEVKVNKEEIDRKVYDEMINKEEEEEVVVPEMPVPEKVEEVAVPEEMVAAAGKVAKKGKTGMGAGPPGVRDRRVGRMNLDLIKIFEELDDHFLKASESAHEVSKMLEATRLHYHSNFADNRGHIDHSARVMRVITWNRSFKGLPDLDDGRDNFDSEEHETHATVLDKLLAWEKKLYDEVKAGEIMKFDYQKKVAMLNKQKKKGAHSESLEKLKAAVSHLHTRYIVDMQSLDSTVSEINRLRDEQLYPKLVQLVDGMSIMWEAMRSHHEIQFKVVATLRSLDVATLSSLDIQFSKETSEHHHERTLQLRAVVQDWHLQFCKLIDHQKEYIKALNEWLRLNIIPIESSLREKVSSPPRVENPPIKALLTRWHDFLDKLPDEGARSAINNFAAVVHTIVQHQEEEMKLRDKCEDTRKELSRKTHQFEDWYRKYMQRRTPDELVSEGGEDNPHNEAVVERQLIVDMLKKRLEEEEVAYRKQCIQVREKSIMSLKTRLPELFRSMSETGFACSQMYKNLSSISQSRNHSESLP
ncbi:hypothetical protein HS088_TW12G00338 [Tripterygium wilfordii]|uniref:Golgin subfamily A member 4 n=1 Tax=Tripterygium wilfordii TaxID=458696 RepID=A0A7J7CYP9_TRIWF|nr:protein ALTERED PHOSPHATE STARVATION RESPONSE 1-like [Tripterygium wilfordii]KAF5739138.1 hypothetical protein HS088_TW12G00338 [Tripterygium wilfordii]